MDNPTTAEYVRERNSKDAAPWHTPPDGKWYHATIKLGNCSNPPRITILRLKSDDALSHKTKSGRNLCHATHMQLMKHPSLENYLILEGNHRGTYLRKHRKSLSSAEWDVFVIIAKDADEYEGWAKWLDPKDVALDTSNRNLNALAAS